jgi:hypothetical protein
MLSVKAAALYGVAILAMASSTPVKGPSGPYLFACGFGLNLSPLGKRRIQKIIFAERSGVIFVRAAAAPRNVKHRHCSGTKSFRS